MKATSYVDIVTSGGLRARAVHGQPDRRKMEDEFFDERAGVGLGYTTRYVTF